MKTYAAIAAFAAIANAHMIMQSPQPYSPAPDNSPLEAGGSNFPCKKSGGFTVAQQSKATVGSSVKLAFTGTAVHNGGSCQLSLTKDVGTAVNAGSSFKVIYSILGGCPGTSGQATSYDVPIPSDVPAGDYTFAWTWFNNVGNREMYMNCAPMTISGGSGSDATFSALPDMAVYNIASQNTCKTVESFDVDFPNPGKYVSKGASFKPSPPTCDGKAQTGGSGSTGGGSTGGGSTGSGSGTGAGAAPASSPAGGSGAAPTKTFDDGQYHPPGGTQAASASAHVLAPAASSAAAPADASPTATSVATTFVTAAPSPQAPAAAAPSAAIPSADAGAQNGTFSSPTSGSGASSGASCSTDGALVCSDDGTQFGLCNWGKVSFQPVAAGTKCAGNAIMKKRSVKEVKAILWRA